MEWTRRPRNGKECSKSAQRAIEREFLAIKAAVALHLAGMKRRDLPQATRRDLRQRNQTDRAKLAMKALAEEVCGPAGDLNGTRAAYVEANIDQKGKRIRFGWIQQSRDHGAYRDPMWAIHGRARWRNGEWRVKIKTLRFQPHRINGTFRFSHKDKIQQRQQGKGAPRLPRFIKAMPRGRCFMACN